MLKVGIIGLGFWGETCMKYMLRMNHIKIVGFFDVDNIRAKNISSLYAINCYDHIEKLINECDALIISTPSISHCEIAIEVIRKGKHFFMEYPLSQSIEECRLLVQLIKEANVKCQIGFVEPFNPAYKQVKKYFQDISFVEIKHLLPINRRNLDINIITEILPHDIYVLLNTIKSSVKNINAYGINIITDGYDMINVRFEFQNGCVANITTSRIHQDEHEVYQLDLLQSNAHIKIDFLEQKSELVLFNKITDYKALNGKMMKGIEEKMTFQSFSMNKIYQEMESFFDAITYDHSTCTNEFDAMNVFEINQEIMKQITQKNQSIKI